MNHLQRSPLAWSVWIIVSIFYAYQYVLRVMPNIMLTDIMTQFDIDAATFGQFSGVYYIGYALAHLPIGLLLDRYGPKKIVTISILLAIIGLSPLLFATYWIYPIIGRFLIGIGSSAAILGVFKVIRMLFAEHKFPRMLSFSVTIGLTGAIYGGGPVSYMEKAFGYQVVLRVFLVAGLLLALVSYLLLPNLEKPSSKTVKEEIGEVFSSHRVIWCSVFAGFMVGPLEGFADVWGTLFFERVYGFQGTLAASIPSMIFFGMCFGAPALSLVADKVHSCLGTVIGAGILMTIVFLSLLFLSLPVSVISILLFLVGVCSAYQILAIYQASTYVRKEISGLTTAIANMVIMIFGYVFHSAIGWIIYATGGTTSAFALVSGISMIPFALAIGVIGFILLLMYKNPSPRNTKVLS